MKNAKVKRMVGIALLMAMVIVLQFVSSSIPPIGGIVSISLVLIPIVMGGAVFGIGAGTILGATFGVVVLINCITGADQVCLSSNTTPKSDCSVGSSEDWGIQELEAGAARWSWPLCCHCEGRAEPRIQRS